jgi:sulfofructose kinase
VLSEPALQSLSGDSGIERGLATLAARLGRSVGVTAGERGFFWWTEGRIVHAPAPGVAVVDTLSAGDVFHGAFALALAEGRGIADAGRFACVAASLKCRRFGGRLGAPGRDEVDAFLATGNNV